MEKRDTLQESLGGASNEFPPFLVCAYTVIRISVSVAVKVWRRGRKNVAGASSSKMGKRKGDYAKRRRRQGRGLSRSRALQKMYYCVMHVPSLHPTSSHRSFPFPSSVEKNLFWNQSCVIGNPICPLIRPLPPSGPQKRSRLPPSALLRLLRRRRRRDGRIVITNFASFSSSERVYRLARLLFFSFSILQRAFNEGESYSPPLSISGWEGFSPYSL